MRSIRAIAVVVLLAALTGPAWSTCQGWQPTAAMRAACCNAAGHACDQTAPDDCCARGEQQHQDSSLSGAPAAVMPPRVVALSLFAPPPESVGLAALHVAFRANRHVPTHVLLSVFLV